MAEATTTRKKRKVLSEETRKRKRESDRSKGRTRIIIGPAFARWRELKEEEGFVTDADLAVMLLDYYESRGPATSTPYKGEGTSKPPGPPVSSVTDSSDHDRGREMVLSGVEELITESQKVDVLESSMHSLAISEEPDDDLEAANDLQNSMIEMEEAVCLEDEDSDEDYVPFIYLRSTRRGAEIEKLPEIHIDEAVLDVEDVPIVPEEDQRFPFEHKVETVEDLIGKKANICYNDNLLSLARYMQLPVQFCQFRDPILGTQCNGRPPFHVQLKSRGTGVILEWVCTHGHTVWHWNSQPVLKFGMQGGDFMLSTNILLSGNNHRKIHLLFNFMCMGMVSESTFFAIQSEYCLKPVEEFWEESRERVLNRLRQKTEVVVLGDGRMDSPGHCAQYCTYTMIELETRDIVHIVSEDKRKCGRNSVILEKVCFESTMDCLLNEIPIKEVVTDAHRQISALLDPVRGKYKDWSLKGHHETFGH
ncbi:uncharacterized protein [Paramisgurnus dabryanus]|uniref:uncharacterized protein n=1 Tax=Paramisgurnus dabryanus TaxID=90735 RepID=UPI0031F3929C